MRNFFGDMLTVAEPASQVSSNMHQHPSTPPLLLLCCCALAASSQQPAAAAASAAAAGLSAAGVAMAAERRGGVPRFAADCRVSDRLLKQMGQRGSILQGCLPRQSPIPDIPPATDKIQTPPMPTRDSLQELLQQASGNDPVVVRQSDYIVDTGAMFSTFKTLKASDLRSAAGTTQQAALSAAGAAPEVVAAAGGQQPSQLSADVAAVGTAPGSGGRRLQQAAPISWCIANQSQVGVSPDPCGRTLLSAADTATMPYKAMVQLRWTTAAGTFQCSGSIISPDDVLTAAHCLADMKYAANATPFGPWTIKAGVHGSVAAGGT